MAEAERTTTPPVSDAGPTVATCEAHGEPTRLTCVDCGKPICPKCWVRTEVGLKCEADARPADVPAQALALLRPKRSPLLLVGLVVLALAAVAAAVALSSSGDDGVPEALPPVGTWEATPALATIRGTATATVLGDGAVLVAGGGVGQIAVTASELFDTSSGTWRATGELRTARRGHAAALLPDGRVMVAGGIAEGELLAATEVYEPRSGTWTAVAPMNFPRVGHSLTPLSDGTVLAAGGTSLGGDEGAAGGQSIRPDASAEIFDPAKGTWSLTAEKMQAARFEHTATRLDDGRVLVVGGRGAAVDGQSPTLSSVELYDPAIRSFVGSTALADPRANHAAVKFPDGSVMVSGGVGGLSGDQSLATVEIFNPGRARWDQVAPMAGSRAGHTATVLSDGRVLVAAGESVSRGARRSLDTAEVFEPGERQWRSANTMACARSEQAAVLLGDGSVLVVAGDALFPGQAPTAQGCVDRYRP